MQSTTTSQSLLEMIPHRGEATKSNKPAACCLGVVVELQRLNFVVDDIAADNATSPTTRVTMWGHLVSMYDSNMIFVGPMLCEDCPQYSATGNPPG